MPLTGGKQGITAIGHYHEELKQFHTNDANQLRKAGQQYQCDI